MLDKIVEAAVRNRLLVLLGLTVVIGAAVLLLPRLSLDAFPDVTNVLVTVNKPQCRWLVSGPRGRATDDSWRRLDSPR